MATDPVSLATLAELAGGNVDGDSTTNISGAATLGDVAPGQITFVDQPERLATLATTGAAAAVVAAGTPAQSIPTLAVDDVHVAFSAIYAHFHPPCELPEPRISSQATVSESATIGAGVDIQPGATICDDVIVGANCRIGAGAHLLTGCVLGPDVTIGPGTVLYEKTVVGQRSTIHAGAVLGTHGFGYRQRDGHHVRAAQLGYVEIGDDVEIGANVTVDRGAYGPTRIGDGTKIDNLVQIAHNCQIGRHNLICSQVGIAGSTTTGDYVVMGGQAGVRDHVHIGTGAVLSAMAGISNDVPDGAVMMGIPATPAREQKLKQAALAKLPEMRKQFKQLQRQLAERQETNRAA